ncbi:glycoside hydrolase family 26 protein [Frankia nepalensis]|nr:glycosyl hydrolase [Frankia nepalensis]
MLLAVALVLGALIAPSSVASADSGGIPGAEVDPRTLPGVLLDAAEVPSTDEISQFPVMSTGTPATEPLTDSSLRRTMVRAGEVRPLAASLTATVEDTAVGTGTGQVSYSGSWTVCGGCRPSTPNNSFRYSLNAGASATVRFTGTQIRIYGVKERAGGLASVRVDGGPAATVDTYASSSSVALLYDSGPLTNGTHAAVLTNLGQRNAASAAFAVVFDRAEIFTDPGGGTPPTDPPAGTKTTVEDNAVGPNNHQVTYTGDWTACGGCAPSTPNNSFRYSLRSGASATIRWTGNRILLYGVKERSGGVLSVRVDGGTPTTVDTYAPTSSNALIFDSGRLTFGDHSAVITNTGQRNAASLAFAVSFDRAETYSEGTTPPTGGNRSGKPWLSGANGDPLITPNDVEAFCSFRGKPCDVAQVFVARNNWNSIVLPSFAQQNFAGWPGKLILSVPPFPEGGGYSLQTCATGAYDSYWREFGRTLNSTGRQDSIVRLAWEANGNWYPWSGTDPVAYVNCYRKVVDAVRSTASPDPRFDWTINAHGSQNPPSHNPLDLYPGDAWVDIVSIDAYDHHPPSRTPEQFKAQAEAPGGITWLYNFARAHGKLFGVAEWGVASGSGANGGGDNPNFIQFMHDWMLARADKGMYYEAYFNNCEMRNIGSNIYRPVGAHCLFQNTQAASRYTQLW